MIIGASSGSPVILILLIAVAVIYLLVVRPRNKARIKQQQMTNELRVGDEVLTAGGIYGTISGLDDDEVTVQIAPETEVRVARRAIAGVLNEPEAEEEDPEADEGAEPEKSQDDEGSSGDPSTEENRG